MRGEKMILNSVPQVGDNALKDRQNSAISLIRLLSTTAIVLCHVLQYYGLELAYWFNIGVQIFFVMSGYLYGNKTIDRPIDFYRKRLKKILVPYYLLLLPSVLLYYFFAPEILEMSSVIKSLFLVGIIQGMNHLWFVRYIIVCYLMTPALYWLKKKSIKFSTKYMFLIWCLTIVMVICGGMIIEKNFLAACLTCYIVGYFSCICYTKFEENSCRMVTKMIFVFSLVVTVVRIYLKYCENADLSGMGQCLFEIIDIYGHPILGYALFCNMMWLFSQVPLTDILKWSDKYSYYVYLVHHLF